MASIPPEPSPESPEPLSDRLRDLREHPAYLCFLAGRFFSVLANGAQAVIIAWEVYEIARETMSVAQSSFLVGMIGLVQFLPLFALALFAGETADRHDRRRILVLCFAAQLLTAAGLAARSQLGGGLWMIFALSALFGCARAFFLPAASALGPMLVPKPLLPRAIAASSLAFQLASIVGPALGGLLCALSPILGYLVCVLLDGLAGFCVLMVRSETRPVVEPGRSRRAQIREGLEYVWANKLVFGAISLDLFAVLLGGATGLLPVFAADILEVGAGGFGVLRAAPSVGALVVAAHLALRPVRSRAGVKMLLAVALFGVVVVGFALSRSFVLSVALLAVMGGADMVSVYIRQSLIQLSTPDALRGRVSAVSTLFIGASNELGEFESGVVASVLGPVAAVAFGGAGAIVVTAAWAWLFPALRKADRLV